MIVYKQKFSDLTSSWDFPGTLGVQGVTVNKLVSNFDKLSPDDNWDITGGKLVQSTATGNGYLIANVGSFHQAISFTAEVGPTAVNFGLSIILAGDNALSITPASPGVLISVGATSISIHGLYSSKSLTTIEYSADTITAGEVLDVTCSLYSKMVYCKVKSQTTLKEYSISQDLSQSQIELDTYIGFWGGSNLYVNNFTDLVVSTYYPRIIPTPSMLTLADIRVRVNDEIQDGSISNATIDRYINRAYKEIYSAEHWRERKGTIYIPIYAGVSEYTLPVKVEDISSLRRSDGMLRYEGEQGVNMLHPEGVAPGTPEHLTVSGRQLNISPTPSTDWDGTVIVCEHFMDLTKVNSTTFFVESGELDADGQYPNLHPDLHECVAVLAAIKILAILREDGVAPSSMRNDFDKQYKRAKNMALGEDVFPSQIRIQR